ncbi:Pleckstrin like protein, partial [Nannochloropsis gaditana]
ARQPREGSRSAGNFRSGPYGRVRFEWDAQASEREQPLPHVLPPVLAGRGGERGRGATTAGAPQPPERQGRAAAGGLAYPRRGGGVGSIQGSREGGREGGRVEEGAEPVAPALLLVPSTSSSPPVSLVEEEGQGEGVRSPGVLMELSTPADVKGYEMVGTLFKRRGGIGRLLGWKPRLFTLYRGKLCYYEAEYLEEVDNRRKPR